MDVHADYKYSVTIQSDDAALAVSMRALAWYCQKSGNKQVVNAGNGLPKWQKNGHKITFYFSNPAYRSDFLKESERLFRGVWEEAERRDDNPAPRQS